MEADARIGLHRMVAIEIEADQGGDRRAGHSEAFCRRFPPAATSGSGRMYSGFEDISCMFGEESPHIAGVFLKNGNREWGIGLQG